jgi:hypothetical protein
MPPDFTGGRSAPLPEDHPTDDIIIFLMLSNQQNLTTLSITETGSFQYRSNIIVWIQSVQFKPPERVADCINFLMVA